MADPDDDRATEPRREADTEVAAPAPADPSTVQSLAAATPARQRPRDTQGDLYPGDRLGDRYVVKTILGFGGMGAVYRVFDEILGEDVALKAVRSATAANEGLRDEVRLAQKVTHANVCRTYDLEDVGGRHFVKMEFLAGETLSARLAATGPQRIAEAVRIARAVAAGLGAAHARGIVHRDLKPGNVMLVGERVVLMDFGLAQHANAGATDRSGTPGYMAPEQLRGDPVDARTDLYALGCLLYELLAGEPAFPGRSPAELIERQTTAPTPDIRARRGDVPRWLATATRRLLAQAPGERERGLELLVRGPRSWGLAAALGAVAVSAGVLGWWLTRSGPPWAPEIVDLAPAYDENANAPAISPDGATLAYTSNFGTPTGEFAVFTVPITGGTPTRVTTPGAVVDVRWLRDGRGFVLSTREVGHEPVVSLVDRDGALRRELGMGMMADDCGGGRVVAIHVGDAGSELVMLGGDAPRVLYRVPTTDLADPHCDAAGRRVLFWRGSSNLGRGSGDLWVVDADGQVRALTHDGISIQGAFTPDGSAVVFAGRDRRQVHLFEIPVAGGARRRLTVEGGPDLSPSVTPDGRTLVFNRDLTYSRVTTSDGTAIPLAHQYLGHVQLTSDGAWLVAERADAESEIVAIHVADHVERVLARGGVPFLSSDGRSVYFAAGTDRRELDRVALDGGEPQRIAQLPAAIVDGVDTAGGVHLAVSGGGAEIRGYGVGAAGAVLESETAMVIPAPAGPWRVDQQGNLAFAVAPGQRRTLPCRTLPVWLDDHRLACAIDTRVELVDVSTGDREPVGDLPPRSDQVAIAGEGARVRWIAAVLHGLVTRHAITNFADRPWKP